MTLTTAKASPPEGPASPPVAWHRLPPDEVLAALDAPAQGLPEAVSRARLARHGPNALPRPPAKPAWRRLAAQFNNTLIHFLLAASVAALAMGHLVDAVVIIAVVTVNAIVGFLQEGKAEQALASIRQMIAPQARVLRDGRRLAVPADALVPGDVVLLEAGDRVPADLRLLRTRGLRIDESLLTGESTVAEKSEAAVDASAPLAERTCMAYSGTLVSTGQATGVVVATGASTEIGHIGRLLHEVDSLDTPLLTQINRFGKKFTLWSLGAAFALFLFAVLARQYRVDEALMVVVSLAVGIVPEGLPAVITITLAIGVRRMAARNAVVRRLPAVETLGATSVICSDKTGTLTRNEMTVVRVAAGPHDVEVGGVGYNPAGGFSGREHGQALHARDLPPEVAELILCGALCNDALLQEHDGAWRVDGDPMEGALLALAMKSGLEPADTRAQVERVDEIPFDAEHRYMATLHRRADGSATLMVKGAPETVLGLCTGVSDPAGWQARIDQCAAEGQRVLGFASRHLGEAPARLGFEHVRDLHWLGVAGFIDPPREEARQAIAECRRAGIAVKMITGDHARTAQAIARQLALADDPQVLTGAELDALDDEALVPVAQRVSVFARTSPEHKLRIVRALQARGAVVAMTGDGVNDAPSLKQADVGIAMGIKGTEAAKEAARIVLLDDNFRSIVAAVHEGRVVYDNIRKMIAWTLPTNGGEVLGIITALAVGMTLPMTPAQILWINLILTITLGLSLAFEPAEPDVMRRAPRPRAAALLSPFMLWRFAFVSVLFAAIVLGVFGLAQARGMPLEAARTMVVNTLVVLEIFYLFNVRHLRLGVLNRRAAMGTPAVLAALGAVVAAQFAYTYLPAMNRWFASQPLSLADGLLTVGCGVGFMLVLEAEKALLRRLGWFDELAR